MEFSELKSLKPGILLETTRNNKNAAIYAVLITENGGRNSWIPTGSIVMLLEHPTKEYIHWAKVFYDEKKYYIMPENLKIAKER